VEKAEGMKCDGFEVNGDNELRAREISCEKLFLHQQQALTLSSRVFNLLPSTAERVSLNKTLRTRSRLSDLPGEVTRWAARPEKTD